MAGLLRLRPTAVTLCALAALGVAGLAVPTQAGPVTTICTTVDGPRCKKTASRPQRIRLGGDGRTMGIKLRWHGWGSRRATARGTWRTNHANGYAPPRFTYARLRLTATGRRACGARRVYRTLKVYARGEPPYRTTLTYAACP